MEDEVGIRLIVDAAAELNGVEKNLVNARTVMELGCMFGTSRQVLWPCIQVDHS